MSIIEQTSNGTPASWLSNLLPAGRDEMVTHTNESSAETTPSATPVHQTQPLQSPFGHQKPVNLLSESLPQHGRKLSEREQRDCEVIGTKKNSSS